MSEPTPSPACNDCGEPLTPGEQWSPGHCPPCAESSERIAEVRPLLTALERGYQVADELAAKPISGWPKPWRDTVAELVARHVEEAEENARAKALHLAAELCHKEAANAKSQEQFKAEFEYAEDRQFWRGTWSGAGCCAMEIEKRFKEQHHLANP